VKLDSRVNVLLSSIFFNYVEFYRLLGDVLRVNSFSLDDYEIKP